MPEKMLNSNGDVAHELTEDELKELDRSMSFFDRGKVSAFCNCVVDLAEANELNLLEMLFGLRNLILSVEAKLVEKNGDLADELGLSDTPGD